MVWSLWVRVVGQYQVPLLRVQPSVPDASPTDRDESEPVRSVPGPSLETPVILYAYFTADTVPERCVSVCALLVNAPERVRLSSTYPSSTGRTTRAPSELARVIGQYQVEPLLVQVSCPVSSPAERELNDVRMDVPGPSSVMAVTVYANWTTDTVNVFT